MKHRAVNVRMRNLLRDADLVVEARQKFWIARNFGWQELKRYLLAEPQVRGAVNLAHASHTQQTDDPIAIAHPGTKRPSSLELNDALPALVLSAVGICESIN